MFDGAELFALRAFGLPGYTIHQKVGHARAGRMRRWDKLDTLLKRRLQKGDCSKLVGFKLNTMCN